MKSFFIMVKDSLKKPGWNPIGIGLKIGFIVVLTCLLTTSTLYIASYGYSKGLFASYFDNLFLLFLNAWPIFISLALLFVLSSSWRITFAIGTLFWTILAVINQAKVHYRHEILKILDYELIQPALKILPRYIGDIKAEHVILAVVFIAFIFYGTKQLPSLPKHSWKATLALTLLLALVASGYTRPYQDGEIARGIGEASGLDNWVEVEKNQSSGFVYAFIYESQKIVKSIRQPYDKKLGQEIVKNYSYKAIPDGQRIHVFTMLLESFKDFSADGANCEFVRDPYVYFHQLQQEALTGHFLADVYGGGTIKSEVAFLTGYGSETHHGIFHKPRQSYVRYFKDNGYYTEGMHPNDGYFYNRANIYPNLGFDQFLHSQNHFHNNSFTEGNYFDEKLFQDILNRFHKRPKGKPYFNYTATMQNHGPYGNELKGEPYIKKEEGVDEASYAAINNFLIAADNTGYELWNLTRAFEEEKEPIVFICFGDHSPGLSDEIYDILKMNVDDKAIQSYMNKIRTPYLVWANTAAKNIFAKDFKGELPDSDPDLVMAQVFRYLDWGGTPYMQYLQDFSKQITVYKDKMIAVNGSYQAAPDKAAEEKIKERSAIEGVTKNDSL